MIGKTISHYKIIEKLGQGGMGEVYLAHDTDLDREVALKFLPLFYSNDTEINERFKREAKAAAALNHPNIITIYEIGVYERQSFIAMEYVEGESLRDKINKKELTIQKVIELTIQICEGLSKAHQAGIVHRDIKPENILINTEGTVKILDFGLAQKSGTTKLTKETSTLGTVNYMSPEQCQSGNVDHRSDIWSLGVVFYEMITGQLPFKGDYEQAFIYSILNDSHLPITQFISDIPSNIEHAIDKALQKNLTQRYQNIKDFLKDFKIPSDVVLSKNIQEKSIIVLPFIDMSPDKDNEYFSDGLTEEIITDLSYIKDLLVISRSSAMTFKGTKKRITEIAQEVNVQCVLEGSVRKAGNNIRITAQLIDAINDVHIWAEKYNGTLDDIFDIQEKVSRSIVDSLKIKLNSCENKQISEHPIDNVQAYECFLKARQLFMQWTEEALEKALYYLNTGLDIVGENEYLYAGLALVYYQYVNAGIKPDSKYLNKAKKYINNIFQLNPDSVHGYRLLGFIQHKRGDIQEAVNYTKKAITINPNEVDNYGFLCFMYLNAGKPDAALPLVQKMLKLEPMNSMTYWQQGYYYYIQGKFPDVIEHWLKAHELEPMNPAWRLFYAQSLAYNNRIEDACNVLDSLLKDTPHNLFAWLGKFLKYSLKGEKELSVKSVTNEMIVGAKWHELYALFMVESYSLINEKTKALEWCAISFEQGLKCYPFLNEHDPFLENIRGEESFKKLMERVKNEWENFEV